MPLQAQAFDPDVWLQNEGASVRTAPPEPPPPPPFDPDAWLASEGVNPQSAAPPERPTPAKAIPPLVPVPGAAAPIRPAFSPQTLARGELAVRRGLALARGEDPNAPEPIPATQEEMARAGGIRATPEWYSRERMSQLPARIADVVGNKLRQAVQIPGDVFLAATSPTPPALSPEGKRLPAMSALEVGLQSTANDQSLWDWDRKEPSLSDSLAVKGDADQLYVNQFAAAVKNHASMQKALQEAKTKRESALGQFGQQVAETAGPTAQSMLTSLIPGVGQVAAYDFWLRQGYGNFMGEGLKRYNIDASTLNADQVRKLDQAAKDMAGLYAGVEFIQRALPGAPGAKTVETIMKRFPDFNNRFTRYVGRGLGEALEEGVQKIIQEAFDKQVADIVGVNLGANDVKRRGLIAGDGTPERVGTIPKTDVWSMTKVGAEEALRSLPVVLAVGLPGVVADRTKTPVNAPAVAPGQPTASEAALPGVLTRAPVAETVEGARKGILRPRETRRLEPTAVDEESARLQAEGEDAEARALTPAEPAPVAVAPPPPAEPPKPPAAEPVATKPQPTEDYRGVHRAPTGEFGEGSLDAMNKTYPDDIYGLDAARFYGDRGDSKLDQKAAKLIRSLRGKPDAEVTVYRAVPANVEGEIQPGDWVTPIREYAEGHGERFKGGTKILSRKVRAGDLFTEGNSIYEYGWRGEPAAPPVAEPAAPPAATKPQPAQPATAEAKAPELMTPEEWIVEHRRKLEPGNVPLRAAGFEGAQPSDMPHRNIIRNRALKGNPVSAAAVDAYGIKLPEGYVRSGDRYVYQPAPVSAKPEGATATAKEPWQMTRGEYVQKQIDEMGKDWADVDTESQADQRGMWESQYLSEVMKSKRDADIPANVLAELPDAQRQQIIKFNEKARQTWTDANESWNMTYRQFLNTINKGGRVTPAGDVKALHRASVQRALAAGKPVPPSVLADYPDLKPTPAPVAPVASPTAEPRATANATEQGVTVEDALNRGLPVTVPKGATFVRLTDAEGREFDQKVAELKNLKGAGPFTKVVAGTRRVAKKGEDAFVPMTEAVTVKAEVAKPPAAAPKGKRLEKAVKTVEQSPETTTPEVQDPANMVSKSGRKLPPFPDKPVVGNMAQRRLNEGDKWLIEQAIAEAEANGDDYNATRFKTELPVSKRGLPDASRADANLYLFGREEVRFERPAPAAAPAAKKTLKPTAKKPLLSRAEAERAVALDRAAAMRREAEAKQKAEAKTPAAPSEAVELNAFLSNTEQAANALYNASKGVESSELRQITMPTGNPGWRIVWKMKNGEVVEGRGNVDRNVVIDVLKKSLNSLSGERATQYTKVPTWIELAADPEAAQKALAFTEEQRKLFSQYNRERYTRRKFIEKPTEENAKKMATAISTPAAAVKVETTADAKTISVPAADKPGLPPKEQKKYLIAEIEKAMEGARDDVSDIQNSPEMKAVETRRSGLFSAMSAIKKAIDRYQEVREWAKDANISSSARDKFKAEVAAFEKGGSVESRLEERRKIETELTNLEAQRRALYGTVTIEVPGDGTFEILNSKETLRTFKKQAAKFPVSTTSSDATRTSTAKPVAVAAVAKKRPSSEADMTDAVAPMASTDESKDILMQVHVDGKAKAIVATDGKRMAVVLDAPFKETKHKVKEWKTEKDETTGKSTTYATGKMVEGEYPNWRQVIPGGVEGQMPKTGFDNNVTVDTLDLARKLNQALAVLKGGNTDHVTLYRTPDGKVELATSQVDVGGYESADISTAKPIGSYNAEFLRDGMTFFRKMGNESVRLEWQDDLSPAIFLGKREYYVVMPMRGGEGTRLRPVATKKTLQPRPGPGDGSGPGAARASGRAEPTQGDASIREKGNAIMPSTGTTPGDPSLPLYRFVDGKTLSDPERGMHWTHSYREMEQMASESEGFIITAKHPGLDRVMDWENKADRPVMEREIGGYEYRDKVFPEVPIRPGKMDILSIVRVDANGKRTTVRGKPTPQGDGGAKKGVLRPRSTDQSESTAGRGIGSAGRVVKSGYDPEMLSDTTATTHAYHDMMAERRGRGERTPQDVKHDEELAAELDSKLTADPDAGRRLIDAINDGKQKVTTDLDVALLLHETVKAEALANEANSIDASLAGKTDPASNAERAKNAIRMEAAQQRLDDIYRANSDSGSESGRALRARQLMMNDAGDLVRMQTRRRVVNGGKTTGPQDAETLAIHKEFKDIFEKMNERMTNMPEGPAKDAELARLRKMLESVRDRWTDAIRRDKLNPKHWIDALDAYLKERRAVLPSGVYERAVAELTAASKIPDEAQRNQAIMDAIDKVNAHVGLKTGDWFDAYVYTNMLSNPMSHVRNMLGNLTNQMFIRPASLVAHGKIGEAATYLRKSWGAAFGGGFFNSPAWRTAVEAFHKGETNKWIEGLDDPDVSMFQRQQRIHGPKRKYLRPAWKTLTFVGRFMEAQDKYFGAMIEAGEAARLMKTGESFDVARTRAEALANKYLYRDKLNGKPDKSLDAVTQSLERIGHRLDNLRRDPFYGRAVKLAIPFLKTPVKIAQFNTELSALGYIGANRNRIAKAHYNGVTYDEMVSQLKSEQMKAKPDPEVTARLKNQIEEVDVTHEERLGKAAIGTMFTIAGFIAAAVGNTTWAAPKDEEAKKLFYDAGYKPFSVRIGNKWIPMMYFGPAMIAFALPAAMRDKWMDNPELADENAPTKLAMTILAPLQIMLSQLPLEGLSNLLSTFSGKEDYSWKKTIGRTITQAVPASGLLRWINGMVDPTIRKPEGIGETIEAGIPGLSDNLKAIKDTRGLDAKRSAWDAFAPYKIGTVKEDYAEQYQDRMKMLRAKAEAKALAPSSAAPASTSRRLTRSTGINQ